MEWNAFVNLALERRSVRRYLPARIADDSVEQMALAALAAPSSFGHDPAELVAVRDQRIIGELAACKRLGGSQIAGAGVVFVVMARTADARQAEFWIEDASVASGYLLLAAECLGLGACWVQIRNRMGRRRTSDEEVRAVLGVPDGYTVLCLVAVGEKGETKQPRTRSNIDLSRLHVDHF